MQKKDKDSYTYYCCIEILLTRIAGKNQVTYNRENIIILNKAKQHILKDTIRKFILNLRDPGFWFCIIQYKAKPVQSFYKIFKKAKVLIFVLDAKLQIDKESDLKVGYKVFRSSQTLVMIE